MNFSNGKGGGNTLQTAGLKPVAHNPNLARQNKNVADAAQIVGKYAKSCWLAINGAVLRHSELSAEKSRKAASLAQRRYEAAIQRRDGLNERINMARHRDGDDSAPAGKDVNFPDWNSYDQIMGFLCGSTMVGLLSLGVVNVATTILASGIPVFLEHPYLAWMLGGLVPAAAISIKSAYHMMDLDSSRRFYAQSIFGLSALITLVWIVLFALSFEGATAEIDWSSFSDTGTGGGHSWINTLRTIVQIVGEIVIGASLFLVIDRIQATYSSSYSIKNPKWVAANKRVEKVDETADINEARTLQIREDLDKFVTEAISILHDMQSSPKR